MDAFVTLAISNMLPEEGQVVLRHMTVRRNGSERSYKAAAHPRCYYLCYVTIENYIGSIT